MVNRFLLRVPQENINDEYAQLLEWAHKDGDFCKKGEFLISVETTKSVYDVNSPSEGYIFRLACNDEILDIGAPLAVISNNKDDSIIDIKKWIKENDITKKHIESSKKVATKKAIILANKHGISIDDVMTSGDRVTEKDVINYSNSIKNYPTSASGTDTMDDLTSNNRQERILIIGGGLGAMQILDSLNGNTLQRAIGLLDDNHEFKDKTVMGLPFLGGINLEIVKSLYQDKKFDSVVISISTNILFREKIFNEIAETEIPFTNIIHPKAHIGSNASLGMGNVILAFCHVGACAVIGKNNFFSAYTNIEHHCNIGDHNSYGPVISFSACVNVGDRVRLGTGIFVEPYLSIGNDCIISSGSVITRNLSDECKVKVKSNLSIN